MQWTISRKLFVALVIISMVILVMSALFGRLSFQRGFQIYLDARESPVVEQFAQALAGEYAASEGWSNLEDSPRRWRGLMRAIFQQNGQLPPGWRRGDRFDGERFDADRIRSEGNSGAPDSRGVRNPRGVPPPRAGLPPRGVGDLLGIGARLGLFGSDGRWIAGAMVGTTDARLTEIEVAGAVVGQLRLAPIADFETDLDIEFDRQQSRSIVYIALLLLVLAAVASLIIARQFTQPIRRLADGTRAIAKGNYDQPVTLTSADELGVLASDVNSLAQVLDNNRESRRRWLADINHEMRTPLAVLQAELHSLDDGVRPFDKEAVASLQSEVDRLQRLTEDLYSLSAADEGSMEFNFVALDANELVRELVASSVARFEALGLTLELQGADSATRVQADAVRITQLLSLIHI